MRAPARPPFSGAEAAIACALALVASALFGCTATSPAAPGPPEAPRLALRDIRRLPLTEADWSVPVWHPDGEALVVNKTENGGSQLWLVPLDAGPTTQLTRGPGSHITAYGRAWGPKGLLYSSDEIGEQEIWLMDGTTFRARRLGWTGGDNVAPSWSGDGQTFVFARRDYGASRWRLWVATPAGKVARLEMSIDATGDSAQAAWSPDDLRMLFQYGSEGEWNLWVANASPIPGRITATDTAQPVDIETTVTPFVVAQGAQSDATWVGDTSDVLFSYETSLGAGSELYMMASGVIQRLAGAKESFGMASASPNGKHVAFVRGVIGQRSVYLADLVPASSAR